MIDLDLTGMAGGAVYLDVQEVEARRHRGVNVFALTGTLGDGLYEGEVLVEIGPGVEVTFVDEWLDGGDIAPLLLRTGREVVKRAIAQAAGNLLFCLEAEPAAGVTARVTGYEYDGRWCALRPREYGQLELPLLVAEREAGWERQAA